MREGSRGAGWLLIWHGPMRSEVRSAGASAQGPVGGADISRVTGTELTRGRVGRERRTRGLAVLVLVVAGLSGCASHGSSAGGARVVVVEHDFGLVASPVSVRAGTVTLHIENHGPSTHELNVDETSFRSGALPLRQNGLQVNEDSAQLHPVDSISGIRVGTTQDLTLHLAPGRYVLFSNLEGHYLGGMHVGLDVTS
jgi:uncharacterized cupredoxin-like copper-binding protein